MAFLIKKDFEALIQPENLQQVIGTSTAADLYLDECIRIAIAEATSYLSPRYYIAKIFNETNQVYDNNKNYQIYDRIYANYPAWLNNISYSNLTNVSYNGFIYRKNGNMSGYVPGILPTDTMYWAAQYKNDTIYSVKDGSNAGKYDDSKTYAVGDVVSYYYDLFIAKQEVCNIVPNSNISYWGLYASSFSGSLPTVTTFWIEGDNRNHQLKTFLIDIALYHLHARINPKNIPDIRKERYDGNGPNQTGGAIGWLKNVAHGLLNADLPEIIRPQLSVSWGSYPKQDNIF